MQLPSSLRRTSLFASILLCSVAVLGLACAAPPQSTPAATTATTGIAPSPAATNAAQSPSPTAKAEIIPGQWKLVSFGAPW